MIHYCTIKIPHLNYTVKVRPFRPHPELPSAHAYAQRDDRSSTTLFFDRRATPPQVAHEVIHALQFICCDRGISFVAEQEHMGYLAQYIMARILGYVWATG